MDHRIDTVGFVFKESKHPPKLDVERARSLGVDQSFFGSLKCGQDVVLPDGRIILSSECLITDVQQPRTCAVLQDTSDGTSALPFLEDCDLLVHECTYDNSQSDKAIQFGHATPSIAAKIAKTCNARRLALTHFSARYDGTEQLGEEARHELVGADCEVILATDFLEVKF
jgi:ribonuclease Z